MRITCPRCGAAIAGADIDLEKGIGVCRPCGEVIPLPSQQSFGASVIGPDGSSPQIFQPTDLDWHERVGNEQSLHATLKPPHSGIVFRCIFCLVWFSFLAFWYASALSNFSVMGLIFVIFPLGHVFAGFAILYSIIKDLVNRWTFTLDRDQMSAIAGPVPQKGTLRCQTDQIIRFADRPSEKSNEKGRDLYVLLQNGKAERLQLGLTNPVHNAFIAEKLNAALEQIRRPPRALDYRGEQLEPEEATGDEARPFTARF